MTSENKLSKYDLFIWLKYEYDDKLKRHTVIENVYNMIRDKIDGLGLEMAVEEDDFYKKLLDFLVDNTKIIPPGPKPIL